MERHPGLERFTFNLSHSNLLWRRLYDISLVKRSRLTRAASLGSVFPDYLSFSAFSVFESLSQAAGQPPQQKPTFLPI